MGLWVGGAVMALPTIMHAGANRLHRFLFVISHERFRMRMVSGKEQTF